MQYTGISTYRFIPCYASAIHKHTHTHILKPFEDSELMRLKVDTTTFYMIFKIMSHPSDCLVGVVNTKRRKQNVKLDEALKSLQLDVTKDLALWQIILLDC